MPLIDFILEGILRADGITPVQVAAAERLLAFSRSPAVMQAYKDWTIVAPAAELILKRSQNRGVG